MKKQWIALLTGCTLVCSMLAGCGSKAQAATLAAAGSDKGCTDEAILSQLKNDGTPECSVGKCSKMGIFAAIWM